MGLFAAPMALVALPILIYFGMHPEHFVSGRIRDLFIFGGGGGEHKHAGGQSVG